MGVYIHNPSLKQRGQETNYKFTVSSIYIYIELQIGQSYK